MCLLEVSACMRDSSQVGKAATSITAHAQAIGGLKLILRGASCRSSAAGAEREQYSG